MIEEFLLFLQNFIFSFWWILVIPFLLFLLGDLWLFYKRESYINNIEWVLLRIAAPRDLEKTPKSMEQIFEAMHAVYSFGILKKDKWLKGKVENWLSFEIVGNSKSVSFYVRAPKNYRNLVESSIYSQYPDAEVHLVPPEDNYVNNFPKKLPDDEFDVWGTDFILAKDNAYPIKTYPDFEHLKEEKRIDPISNIIETMSNLRGSEQIWLQLLIRPTGEEWVKKGEEKRAEILGEKKESSKNPFGWLDNLMVFVVEFIGNFFRGFVEPPEWSSPGGKDEEKKSERKNLSPGERKIIEAIEEKISKIGFESVLRLLYVDKKSDFSGANISNVMGALRHFNTYNLNALKPNLKTMPLARQPLKKKKVLNKKRRLFQFYRLRYFPRKFSIMNTEELATIYHFPISGVKSPVVKRVMVRKGAPPSDLPIIEEKPES